MTLNMACLPVAADLLGFSPWRHHLEGLHKLVAKGENIQLAALTGLLATTSEETGSNWLETVERQHSQLRYQI